MIVNNCGLRHKIWEVNIVQRKTFRLDIIQDLFFDCGVAQIGLYMSSGGNTIYHNYFLTQTPVCSPEISYYTGS